MELDGLVDQYRNYLILCQNLSCRATKHESLTHRDEFFCIGVSVGKEFASNLGIVTKMSYSVSRRMRRELTRTVLFYK